MMTQLLLSTKLFFPRARSQLVSRPRLIEQLSAGLLKPLTLISAPAGYGKTTVLSDWRLRFGSEYPLAWLSLDADDNNLARFLTYVSAALEILDPGLLQDLITQLHLAQLPTMEELITALINGVSPFPQDFALVLDDCHVITEPAIHAALSYLLDHLPPKMHLVMLTRSDPPIHLAKLRARGDLVELRANDLRFTNEESNLFLNGMMDLRLSGENVSALDQRTEGWAVGLQMAALSMQGKADATSFIKAFTGSNRYILDFLSEEVIQRQSEAVQTFLLQTSVLDRLCGPLCDAVLGDTHNGARMLEELERKNLFLIPLDDERQWFRYHHLFSELLFQNLKRSQSETVDALYQRAADWFERNGYMEDAVGYALKAGNYEYATQLMNQIRTKFLNRGDLHQLLDWIRIFPEEMVRAQPELCFNYASLLTMQGYFDVADTWLKLAEAGMGQFALSDRHVPLNEHRFVIYRSVYARFRGDFAAAVALAQRALELVPITMDRDYGVVLLFLGQAYFYAGNTGEAERILADAIQANLASGHMEAYINACHNLAQLRVMQGRLQDARTIYEHAAQVASEYGKPILSGTEHAGLADLKREWNLLEEAVIEIDKGVELAEAGDHIFSLIDVYLARVRLALSQKDWDSTQNYLQKAIQAARRSPTSIEIDYLLAWQAWFNLAQGKLVDAARWALTKKQEGGGPIDFYGEFEMLMLARVWLAEGKTDLAASALERLHMAATATGRYGRALEAQILLALVDQALGEETQAAERLARALAQAEPEGYIRLFIDEGAPMAKLLYKVTTQMSADQSDYAGKLLAAFTQDQAERSTPQAGTLPGYAIIEPLSRREIEVLCLLADGCSNKEIASQLVISTGTVKRHVVHIFQKLRADNRTQAVAIARQLEII